MAGTPPNFTGPQRVAHLSKMPPATAACVSFPFGFLPVGSSRVPHRSCLSIISRAAVSSSSASIAWLWAQEGAEDGLCNMTRVFRSFSKEA